MLDDAGRKLVGLSACLGGEIPRALETDDWEAARRLAGQYGEIFGEDRFYLELQDHGLPEQRRLNEQLLRLAPEVGLPLVVTNDLHYVHEGQSEAHDVLLCVGTGNNIDTPNRMKFETTDFWLKPAAAMERLFPDQREALLNTRRIAEMASQRSPLAVAAATLALAAGLMALMRPRKTAIPAAFSVMAPQAVHPTPHDTVAEAVPPKA